MPGSGTRLGFEGEHGRSLKYFSLDGAVVELL